MSVISETNRRERAVQRIIERDGEDCFYCGVPFGLHDGNSFVRTLDHFIPRRLGGSSNVKNLRLACFFCNHAKGGMRGEEFLASESLKRRRTDVERWIRIARGLHPRREGYFHPPKSIYVVKKGHLGCHTCGAMGSPDEHLDLFPCLIYRP